MRGGKFGVPRKEMTRVTSDMIFAGLDCVGKLQMWMVCCVQSQQPHFDVQHPTSKQNKWQYRDTLCCLEELETQGRVEE